ncbi:MAG: type II toxin-antitoxin system VapC family toxin [Thermodesulfobacteriota bacterium]
MIGLDTNVLVRYIVQDDKAQAALATKIIEQGTDKGEPFCITPIVLCELAWVLKRCYAAKPEAISQVLEQILRTAHFRVLEIDSVWRALKEYRNTAADFADCLIAQQNRAADCTETLTFDQNAAKANGFRLLT